MGNAQIDAYTDKKGAIILSVLKFWVWLSSLAGLKPKTRYELLNAFGDPEALYFADEKQILGRLAISEPERTSLMDKSLDKANEILEKCRENGTAVITLQDAVYPQRLKNIYDPPVVLYVKGRLPAIDEQAAIGVVGTRKATSYGIKMAQKLGFEITKCGGLVVTGLAEGIDSAAAEGALRAGGSCIGVLGCAIDDVYPKTNSELYDDVAMAGALVSEYPPGAALTRKNFPERNRIISGLSIGVAVVEAPFGSGALITSSLALEQGREVFAVPGNADAPNWFGSNELIRNGAQLVTKGWDVLEGFERLFPGKLSKSGAGRIQSFQYRQENEKTVPTTEKSEKKTQLPVETGQGFAKLKVRTDRKRIDNAEKREYIDLQEQLSGLTENQLKIISVMERKSMHVDDIIDLSGLAAPSVLSELTILQIKGFVTQESGKRFTLNIKKP